jgi:hypothetical protein
MKWASTLIAILFICNIVIDSIHYFKALNSSTEKTNNNIAQKANTKHSIPDVIVFAMSALCYLCLLGYFIWNNEIPKTLVIFFVIVPSVILLLNNAIKASASIKDIILGSNTNHDLSIKERLSFDIIFGTFLNIYTSYLYGRIEQLIIELPIERGIIESMLVIYSVIVMFGFSFIVIVELIRPIKYLQKLCGIISTKTKKINRTITDRLTTVFNDGTFVTARFTNHILDVSSKYKSLFKVLFRIIFVPVVFIIDVVIGFFLCIFWFLICGSILVFLEFVGFLGKGLVFLVNASSNIPERRVVKNTFRLSLIVSVISVVVINRYALIYEYDETFLAIWEFIASAIIIPVIFEWIFTYGNGETNLQPQKELPITSSQLDLSNNKPKNNTVKKAKHRYKRKKK